MPSKLSVYGFISNKKMQSPTGISRHVVVTPNNSSLCALLNESLRAERMSAIVLLNDTPNKEWFGLITSVTERDKSSGKLENEFSMILKVWYSLYSLQITIYPGLALYLI